MTSLAKIPCTIVTGFLGAGKTTLVRHVLENAGGQRLAIIVNEFGDVGIDGEILKGCGDDACPEDNIVELANGCMCCTVADDFVPALDDLLAAPTARSHRDRDLGPGAAQAAGAGVPVAGDPQPGDGRWRHRGGGRRGARRRPLRRRPRGAGAPARRRQCARARQSARRGVRGPARLRRSGGAQQERPARRGRHRPCHGGDRRVLPRAVKVVEARERQGRSRACCSGSAPAAEDDIERRPSHHEEARPTTTTISTASWRAGRPRSPPVGSAARVGGLPGRTTCCA